MSLALQNPTYLIKKAINNAIIKIVTPNTINKYMILKSDNILTGMYTVNPTGIRVNNNILAIPLNIPSGYVAKWIIKLLPVSEIISDFWNQKLKLPNITAIDVRIRPPVIMNNVYKINLGIVNPYINRIIYPYNKSPNAAVSTSVVIVDNKTFLGCTKYESSLPLFIVSDKEYAFLKKKREKPYVDAAIPHNNNTCLKVYPPTLSFKE